ncbi:MAG: adenylyl-sulfate kinase [Candidatus Methanosuratincola petrocarbonis]
MSSGVFGRKLIIKNFTGIDDPYEPPEDAEIIIDTSQLSPEEAAEDILDYLREEGFIKPT